MVTPVLLELLELRDQWEPVDQLEPQELMVARYNFCCTKVFF